MFAFPFIEFINYLSSLWVVYILTLQSTLSSIFRYTGRIIVAQSTLGFLICRNNFALTGQKPKSTSQLKKICWTRIWNKFYGIVQNNGAGMVKLNVFNNNVNYIILEKSRILN
jgi:hypothetical protein